MTTARDLQVDWGPALVIGGAGELTREITGVIVTDRAHRIPAGAGDLVLGVGFAPDEQADLVTEAERAGAAAVVLKGTAPPEARSDGPGVLVVDAAADWGHLISLARIATTAPLTGGAQDDSLFALADALAALCGGSVVVHDPGWQLIAYSGGEARDAVRTATLLGRRAPTDALEHLRDVGILDRLNKGELIHLADGDIADLSERYAAAVLVGGESLGTIWVAPPPNNDEAQTLQGLRRAVEVAALALLRHAAIGTGSTGEREVPYEALLAGARTERLVARRLSVSVDAGFVLAGLRGMSGDPMERAATARRLVSLARSYADAYRVSALTAAAFDTAFMLFPAADDTARRACVRVLADMHARLQASAPHRTVVSSGFGALTEIHAVRTTVAELLGFAERRGWSGLTDTQAIEASWRLEQLREVALAHPSLLEGAGRRLLEHDRATGSDLVPTLRTWFQAGGNARVAAEQLGLHVNTIRNRMRRVSEAAGVDLDDPDERLLVELELRLLSE